MGVKAGFVASTPTFGGAPLTVTFTDGSSGPSDFVVLDLRGRRDEHGAEPEPLPTSTVGNYSVSQTVNNAQGSDTVTRAGYISVCTYLDYYPTTYSDCSPAAPDVIPSWEAPWRTCRTMTA